MTTKEELSAPEVTAPTHTDIPVRTQFRGLVKSRNSTSTEHQVELVEHIGFDLLVMDLTY
jgi:hypothetical protein